MKPMLIATVAALGVVLATMQPLQATGKPTRDDAKAMSERATSLLQGTGFEQACARISDPGEPSFHDGELYVFVLDYSGIVTCHGAHPALAGKNLWGMKDPSGQPFIQNIIETGKAGGGWVTYKWAHPETKKMQDKESYVLNCEGCKMVVGVGIFK